jgi:exodeoxyribonuclease VII large subunit
MQTNLFDSYQDSSEIWSISQLTSEIKGLLETSFPPIWIKGEISNLRVQPSGHRYFVLKDSRSQIKTVLFKGDFSQSGYSPMEGDECLAYGNLMVYEPRGDYQFRVKHLMQDGTGSLRLQFDRLKEKLLSEGLFESKHENQLPSITQKVAIITSPKGAALQDFLSILKRRKWTGEVLIIGSIVQGRDAPAQLLKAIQIINQLDGLDLVILARGGGAIEDLWAFNDEALVRKVASCQTPIISAVGHQTDFVLTDFAANFRAETPSAAAEWITSRDIKQREKLNDFHTRINEVPHRILINFKDRLNLLDAQLRNYSPQSRMEKYYQLLDDISIRIENIMGQYIDHNQYKLNSLSQRLESSSLKSVLNRGFSFFETLSGSTIDRSDKLKKEDIVRAVFQDGKKKVIVKE